MVSFQSAQSHNGRTGPMSSKVRFIDLDVQNQTSAKIRFIGLDVHKDTIAIAVAESVGGDAKALKMISHDVARLLKELKALSRDGWELRVCYEAGPTGYGLHRDLLAAKVDCI